MTLEDMRRKLFIAGLIITIAVSLALSYAQRESSAFTKTNSHGGRNAFFRPSSHGMILQSGSLNSARQSIDPAVFKPIGAKAYQIVRLGDARPPGDAREHVNALIPLSRSGDQRATFQIYLAVLDCHNHLNGAADEYFEVEQRGGVGARSLKNAERKLTECESLSLDSDLWNGPWLDLAAKQGSIEAKILYSIDVNSILGSPADRLSNPEKTVLWKETAKVYLEQAAETGSLDAIMRLSNAYSKGVLVESNSEIAYAYALVANRISPESSGELLVRSLERDLSMKQRESARVLSHQIHDSCCTP